MYISESLLIIGLWLVGEKPSNHSFEAMLLSDRLCSIISVLAAMLPRPLVLFTLPTWFGRSSNFVFLPPADLSPRFSFLYWENTENFIKILRISVYKYGEIYTPQNRSKWHSQASYDIMKPFLWIKPSIQINRWAIPHKISHFLFHGGSKKSHLPVRFYFHLQWQEKRLRQDYVMSHWLQVPSISKLLIKQRKFYQTISCLFYIEIHAILIHWFFHW